MALVPFPSAHPAPPENTDSRTALTDPLDIEENDDLDGGRARTVLARKEDGDSVRGAVHDWIPGRGAHKPLHHVSLHDEVLRQLQLGGSDVPAIARRGLLSLHEVPDRDGPDLPDAHHRHVP